MSSISFGFTGFDKDPLPRLEEDIPLPPSFDYFGSTLFNDDYHIAVEDTLLDTVAKLDEWFDAEDFQEWARDILDQPSSPGTPTIVPCGMDHLVDHQCPPCPETHLAGHSCPVLDPKAAQDLCGHKVTSFYLSDKHEGFLAMGLLCVHGDSNFFQYRDAQLHRAFYSLYDGKVWRSSSKELGSGHVLCDQTNLGDIVRTIEIV